MSQDNNEALFAVQDAVERVYKLLEKRFPASASKAKADLDAAKAAKTAKEARVSTERFARTISDISSEDLPKFAEGLKEAEKATKTFGQKLADGAQKTVSGMLSTITASIPFVGGLVGLMLGEGIRMMTQSLDLERAGLGELLRTVGDGQVAHGLDKFRDELELTYPQVIEIFKKYSSGLGIIGGNMFLSSVTRLHDEFDRLGYSAAEGAEAMAKFAENNSTYLSLRRLNQTQLDDAFRRNMVSVTKFANILKISREEMEKKRSLEAESSELQLFMGQLSESQLAALQDIKAAYGDSAKDMMLSMFRSQKLYGTVDGSERYQAARASGTNERFAKLYDAFQNGRDIADPELAKQMGQLSDSQLQMAALVGEHTQYKQDDIFNSIVEGNKLLSNINNTVSANLSPANDRDVQTGIQLENMLPKIIGEISQQVRLIAEAITGISSDVTGMDPAESIKKVGDIAVGAIKWTGENMIGIITGIRDAVQAIKEFLIKKKDITDRLSTLQPQTKAEMATMAISPGLYLAQKAYSMLGDSKAANAQTAFGESRRAEERSRGVQELEAQQRRSLDFQAQQAAEHKAELKRIADGIEENNRLVATGNDISRRGNNTSYVGP